MPHFNPSGVSDNVVELCNHDYTIASTLHKKPSSSVHAIWESLYPKPFVLKRLVNRFTIKHDLYHGRGDPTKEDLDRAEKCGKFPYRPSDLFLKVWFDSPCCRATQLTRHCGLPYLDLLGCVAVLGARPSFGHVCPPSDRYFWSDTAVHHIGVSLFDLLPPVPSLSKLPLPDYHYLLEMAGGGE